MRGLRIPERRQVSASVHVVAANDCVCGRRLVTTDHTVFEVLRVDLSNSDRKNKNRESPTTAQHETLSDSQQCSASEPMVVRVVSWEGLKSIWGDEQRLLAYSGEIAHDMTDPVVTRSVQADSFW